MSASDHPTRLSLADDGRSNGARGRRGSLPGAGGVAGLVGRVLPATRLQRLDGEVSDLGDYSEFGWVALYFYPGSEEPVEEPDSPIRDAVQHLAFCDYQSELAANDVSTIGISSQGISELRATVIANRIVHLMLSDPGLAVAQLLGLPILEHANRWFYRRTVLLANAGIIAWALHPVADPAASPRQILTWLQLHR